MMSKTQNLSVPASGSSFDGNSQPLGKAAADVAKRLCVIPAPRWAWLVGLGLAAGIILAAGGSAAADPLKSCTSVTNAGKVFKILENQTYALCAVASCFVFDQVAYCKCEVKTGDSISAAFNYDDGKDVCTVNEQGAANGSYMVSTYSFPASVRPGGDKAAYTCPAGSDGAYAQCDGGVCATSTQGQSFPGFDKPLAKDQIICSCPITVANKRALVGYQITGPYPCQQSFFANCQNKTANKKTGSTIYVGAPTGTGRLLNRLLYGMNIPGNRCYPASSRP